jgi:hypothetical protein
MEFASNMTPYLLVAVLTAAITIALLFITKIPTIVVVASALLAGTLYMLYARISDGYWDTFALIAFTVVSIYASVISFAIVGVGRLMHWPFFLGRPKHLNR